LFHYLKGKFSGRRKYKSEHSIGVRSQLLKNWHGKTCSFTATGLGTAYHILALERMYESFLLDVRGLSDPYSLKVLAEPLIDPELLEVLYLFIFHT
jgi:hypothetical protein